MMISQSAKYERSSPISIVYSGFIVERLRGIDLEGNDADIQVEGFTARIFQHEIDPTNGHVYLECMADLTTLEYTIIL